MRIQMPSWKVWVAATILLPVVALLIGLLIPPTPPPIFRLPSTWDPGCPEIRTIWQQTEQSSTYVTAPRGPLLYTGTTTPNGLLYNKLQLKRIGMDGQEVRSVLLNDVSLPAVLDAGEPLWMVYRGGGGFDFIVAQLDPVSLKVRTHWVIPIPKGTAATSGGNHTFPMSLAVTRDQRLLISYGASRGEPALPMDNCQLWILPIDIETGVPEAPFALPGTYFAYGSRLAVTESGDLYWLGQDRYRNRPSALVIDLKAAQTTPIAMVRPLIPVNWNFPATIPLGDRAQRWLKRDIYDPWQEESIEGREFARRASFESPKSLSGSDLLSTYLAAQANVSYQLQERFTNDNSWAGTLESTWVMPLIASGTARQLPGEFTDAARHSLRESFGIAIQTFAFPDGRLLIAQKVIDDPRPGRETMALVRLGILEPGAAAIGWFAWLNLPSALRGPARYGDRVSLDIYDDLWCLTLSSNWAIMPGDVELTPRAFWTVFPAPDGIALPVGTGHNWRVQKSAKP